MCFGSGQGRLRPSFFSCTLVYMNDLLRAVSHHGHSLLFLIVLAEACGLPAPAALALVAAGSAAAAHVMSAPFAFLAAITAMLLGDTLLFFLGRKTGWAFLGFVCGISLNPETCILRSAESFYKHGRTTLLFIKFIPGVNTMAAPLAGSMKMRVSQFLQFDIAGACLYILAYGGAGFIFRDFVAHITDGLQTGSRTIAALAIFALVAFAAYRIFQYFRYRVYGLPPHVGVEEIALRLSAEGDKEVILADVRSHGYYDPGTQRIAGSIRIEPNRLADELKTLPHDKDIYLYCT
ncbi:MAG: Rhodanese domain protein [Acidobacteriaceae bacterium]|nr:Rhodanese domain protein [Acidobacteriaceae bacterium]